MQTQTIAVDTQDIFSRVKALLETLNTNTALYATNLANIKNFYQLLMASSFHSLNNNTEPDSYYNELLTRLINMGVGVGQGHYELNELITAVYIRFQSVFIEPIQDIGATLNLVSFGPGHVVISRD